MISSSLLLFFIDIYKFCVFPLLIFYKTGYLTTSVLVVLVINLNFCYTLKQYNTIQFFIERTLFLLWGKKI